MAIVGWPLVADAAFIGGLLFLALPIVRFEVPEVLEAIGLFKSIAQMTSAHK
jgi:hypothetical protein